MRLYYSLALLVLLCLVPLSSAAGQTPSEILSELGEAFTNGAPGPVIRHLGSRVEISLQGKRQVHSNMQAQYIINQFFSDYPAGSFTFSHTGETGGTAYATGEYRSSGGAFEVNIFLRPEGGSYKITELRFEPR
ncbi:MAG: DUF4783 domain-containing protein [Bacteroidia bacterium]|nr:DUF4783 domain-containing protein [Bacteroidia bacterium]